jgi:hypothetical protein
MVGCERLEKCPIVNETKNGSASDFQKIKETYCYQNFEKCARYIVLTTVGGDFVPKELLPEQVEKAKEIIAGAQEWL